MIQEGTRLRGRSPKRWLDQVNSSLQERLSIEAHQIEANE